jgi:hypothetical protein
MLVLWWLLLSCWYIHIHLSVVFGDSICRLSFPAGRTEQSRAEYDVVALYSQRENPSAEQSSHCQLNMHTSAFRIYSEAPVMKLSTYTPSSRLSA